MKKKIPLFILLLIANWSFGQTPHHDLHFDSLASRWDEAIPLGNGMLGALIWQKDSNLRFSLDRADLWDMRPTKGLHRPEFSYEWVKGQVEKKEYGIVQQYFDAPYDKEAAPSKIPGGALEFDTKTWGAVQAVHLYLENAHCEVKWANGTTLNTFVHATKPIGYFRFENLSAALIPQLQAPKYQGTINTSGDPVGGDDLSRLGYKQGNITSAGNSITYQQEGWGGFTYEINVRWEKINSTTIEGVWSISSQYPQKKKSVLASVLTARELKQGYIANYKSHENWWSHFWDQSAIQVPDSIIEKQWYLEQYKFGSAARRGAPPISLQAVWTADNGRLPPWKGDFHHDLNTELSYWPSYSANHLEEGLSYLDHLDENKNNYQRYTKLYFGKPGLSVPGVTTLDGTEMGGWIQYSLSPTVAAWLSQHYYLQWRYSMDREFLKKRAYPWLRETAVFIENITVPDSTGHRKLPVSSSPETNDNDISAWFPQNTNYDLSLMKFTLHAAAELAGELGLKQERTHWMKLLSEFGDYALTANNEMMVAPSLAYLQSHRHFSHVMAIHPLGLIKWEDGERSQSIIRNTVHLLDTIGSANWCGYSFAMFASLKARAKDGEGAAKELSIFAKAFCSPNSFHLNGDQTKSGFSNFTYRPFTLEGNFAFAAGLQEMLLQSYAGFIEIMPAVPAVWKDISFHQLRAEGAFLVNARKKDGQIEEIHIFAEKGGSTKLKLPFQSWHISTQKGVSVENTTPGFVTLICKEGGTIVLKNGDK